MFHVTSSLRTGLRAVSLVVLVLTAPVPALADDPNTAADLKVSAWMDRANAVYSPGESATLYVKPNLAAYITVLNVGTDGTVAVLFPNQAQPDSRVDAHRITAISVVRAQPWWPSVSAAGSALIKVFASKRPLDVLSVVESDGVGDVRVLRGTNDVITSQIVARIAEQPAGDVAATSKVFALTANPR